MTRLGDRVADGGGTVEGIGFVLFQEKPRGIHCPDSRRSSGIADDELRWRTRWAWKLTRGLENIGIVSRDRSIRRDFRCSIVEGSGVPVEAGAFLGSAPLEGQLAGKANGLLETPGSLHTQGRIAGFGKYSIVDPDCKEYFTWHAGIVECNSDRVVTRLVGSDGELKTLACFDVASHPSSSAFSLVGDHVSGSRGADNRFCERQGSGGFRSQAYIAVDEGQRPANGDKDRISFTMAVYGTPGWIVHGKLIERRLIARDGLTAICPVENDLPGIGDQGAVIFPAASDPEIRAGAGAQEERSVERDGDAARASPGAVRHIQDGTGSDDHPSRNTESHFSSACPFRTDGRPVPTIVPEPCSAGIVGRRVDRSAGIHLDGAGDGELAGIAHRAGKPEQAGRRPGIIEGDTARPLDVDERGAVGGRPVAASGIYLQRGGVVIENQPRAGAVSEIIAACLPSLIELKDIGDMDRSVVCQAPGDLAIFDLQDAVVGKGSADQK